MIDPRRALLVPLSLALVAAAGAQSVPVPDDPLELARLKSYTAHRASSNNPDLDSNDDSKRPIPGETVVLADLSGPGVVTHIWMTIAASEYGWPRLLRLRIYYDGSEHPSVDVPVGDFFGVGHGFERALESVMVNDSSSGRSRNCYWPMPFQRSLKMTLTNEGRRRVSNLYYHVDWRRERALPAGIGLFHAWYRQDLPARPGQRYEILNITGRGHYVGTVLSVVQAAAGWFGEGDEHFFVDGEQTSCIQGTGTEDYFNDAWSFRIGSSPYTGVTVADGTGLGARLSAYRWHIPDPIPFVQGLRFEIEHAGWTFEPDGAVRSAFEERPDLFSSVAFWYQDGPAQGLPAPPYGAARLPHGNARQIEVEQAIDTLHTENGKASVQREVFWGKDVLLFAAAGEGARITIPFAVERSGRYELTAQLVHGDDYGIYSAELDGKPLAEDPREHEPGANENQAVTFDTYFTETYVAEDHLLGWRTLEQGPHTIAFLCRGKDPRSRGYQLGVDTLILAEVGRPGAADSAACVTLRALGERGQIAPAELTRVTAALADPHADVREAGAWALGQAPPSATGAVASLARALDDDDAVVRGLAALALRNLGTAALPARAPLLRHLGDADENVRMMSAQAIGTIGGGASDSVPALIQLAQAPGQHPHVLRSVADALGAFAQDAAAALPVLRELEQIPRVRWAAAAARRKIEGKR
ncbi:MAG: DUF2961 domain-containing protein [Planctomycetota bacterium]